MIVNGSDHQLQLFEAPEVELQSFRDLGFEIEKTKDDSPTLRIINGTERGGESMHHTGGAFSETNLIYGQAFQWGFQKNVSPTIVSLGLGLGYVEVLAAAFSMLHNSPSVVLFSYESVEGLRRKFFEFYVEEKQSSVYEWTLRATAEKFKLEVAELRECIKKSLQENRLQLKKDFIAESAELKSFDVFCYDAYSKKTSPELWDESFMTEIFSRGSEKSCISSYASNGVLKRALASAGYQVEVLEGFQGKRNRTWACK